MRQKETKFNAAIRLAAPAVLSWVLWGYLAAATFYGAVQA